MVRYNVKNKHKNETSKYYYPILSRSYQQKVGSDPVSSHKGLAVYHPFFAAARSPSNSYVALPACKTPVLPDYRGKCPTKSISSLCAVFRHRTRADGAW